MKKLYKNESGFSAVEVLLVILILIVIGAVGYMVYHNDHKATASVTTTAASKPTPKKTTQSATQATKYLPVTQLGIEIPLNSTIADVSYSWDANESNAWFGSASLGQQSIDSSSTCGITSTPQTFNQSLSPDPADPNPIELNNILLGQVHKFASGETSSSDNPIDAKTVTLNGSTYGFQVFPTDCSSTQAFETALSNYISNFETAFSNAEAIN